MEQTASLDFPDCPENLERKGLLEKTWSAPLGIGVYLAWTVYLVYLVCLGTPAMMAPRGSRGSGFGSQVLKGLVGCVEKLVTLACLGWMACRDCRA